MIKTEETYINGSKYSVTQLPARKALALKVQLLKHFGAPLAQLLFPDGSGRVGLKMAKDGQIVIDLAKDDVVKALPMIFSSLDEKTYEDMLITLLTGVRKEGVELTPQVIDFEFAGDLDTLMKVVWYVVEVNFGSFWKEGDTGSEYRSPASQGRPDTPTTSTNL